MGTLTAKGGAQTITQILRKSQFKSCDQFGKSILIMWKLRIFKLKFLETMIKFYKEFIKSINFLLTHLYYLLNTKRKMQITKKCNFDIFLLI